MHSYSLYMPLAAYLHVPISASILWIFLCTPGSELVVRLMATPLMISGRVRRDIFRESREGDSMKEVVFQCTRSIAIF